MIYLDHAATTPLAPDVEAAMRPFAREVFGNPSSQHAAGRAARAAVDDARDRIADLLGARPAEIVFTGGGTEADNLAVKGVARARRGQGTHLVTTAIEHQAVLASCRALEREGFRVTYLSPGPDGRVAAAQVAEAVTDDTVLVSVMYANNETGVIQPVAEIGAVCRARRVPFHVDAVQAAGELPLEVARLQADLLSLSAHKLYGPRGAGLLYARAGTRLQPLLDGGEQEEGRRAGTENVAGIAGLAEALARARDPAETARQRALRDRLLDGLLAIPESRLHGDRDGRLANNANVGFAGIPGETLVVALDLAGIAAGTGSACAAGASRPSHVLAAMGYAPPRAAEALRLTLGRGTTPDQVDETIAAVRRIVAELRGGR